jgi:phosphomannomutase
VKRLEGLAGEYAAVESIFNREGISGVYLNEIDAAVATRVGRALGIFLELSNQSDQGVQASVPAADPRTVVIGNDGNAPAAELVLAAADGLRWAGCRTIDVGPATAGALLLASQRRNADGAILVGNPSGKLGHIGLTLWGRHGAPCSAGGQLDAVQRLFESPGPRPARPYGWRERDTVDDAYLNWLGDYYHAMRPMRIVVEACSPALVEYLNQLTSRVAIELIWQAPSFEEGSRRLDRLGKRVRQSGAHLGVWIDGNAEALRVVDEQATPIDCEAILRLLAREAAADGNDTAAPLFETESSREAIFAAMTERSASLAGDDTGRIWLSPRIETADAVHVLTLLLVILSRTDIPLSRVIGSVIL